MLRNENGFVLVTVSILAMVFVMVSALAIDVGYWYLQASKIQRAADAAALAGAASLPDIDAAEDSARLALRANGVNESGSIQVVFTASPDRFTAQVKNDSVESILARSILDRVTIKRAATASRPSSSPALGSPYNVLGTGDLSIPGLTEKQNFWLAINGNCSAAEDGDYFSSQFEGNKGPFINSQDAAGNNLPASGASTKCNSGQVHNPGYDKNGYSYFIDVPKPTVVGGYVTVRLYDPEYIAFPEAAPATPDRRLDIGTDEVASIDTRFTLYDTNGTPDQPGDDIQIGESQIAPTNQFYLSKWVDFNVIPNSLIADHGGVFRVQVGNVLGARYRGVNAFSIEAQRSWNHDACDVRIEPGNCPRVYARGAISVFNNLSSSSRTKFYFAEVDPSYIGRTFQVFLWDPGEGVKAIHLLGPNGDRLKFSWRTGDGKLPEYTPTTPSDELDVSGTAPFNPALSNNFKFNDRLVVLNVTLDQSYQDMIDAAGGSHWVSLEYETQGAVPNDRTTWGISFNSDTGGPPHLLRSPS